MTLTIELPPTLERRLRDRAQAEGKDAPSLALELIEQTLCEVRIAGERPAAAAAEWQDWVERMRNRVGDSPPGFQLDDSREAIYREREDAQL